jgi:hypothetical protein
MERRMHLAKFNATPQPLERLTWAEICARYPDQHVYVVEAERLEPLHPEFISAILIPARP